MRRLLNSFKREGGASVVEYAVVVGIMVLGLVPAVGFANDAVVTVLDASVAPYVDTSEGGSGDGGGGGGTTTTTVAPTTTTTVPPTTTTTTIPPTTTTTTVPPNQVAEAQFGEEILVPFSETDGVVTYDDVEADGWTYVITSDTGTYIRMVFTTTNPDHKVVIKGFLNSYGVLKTRVIEKY